ncbi:MAG: FAD/NAD(P)-binding protein, partial [Acidocella sp.]|nr:FAD/NAD(P)-binding protein [Acidocella sp.]
MHVVAVPSSCRAIPNGSLAESILLTLADKISDILGEHADTPQRCALIAQALEEALEPPGWLPEDLAEACPTGYRRQVLFEAEDGSFSIGCFVWGPGQHSPIHDHRCWGVIGCLAGTLANETFTDTSPERLAATPLCLIAGGETVFMHPDTGDIHRLGAHGAERAISIHVYGGRFGAVNRNFYPIARALHIPARQASVGQASVAVIGSGYSGTMAGIQLAHKLPAGQSILLCERSGCFATGVAYSTDNPGHLLNVRAANMSGFASDPTHFERWIEEQGDAVAGHVHKTASGVFASRHLYGVYIKSVLKDELARPDNCGRIRLLSDDIVDCVPDRDGYDLVTASGAIHSAHSIVLATGHVPPVQDRDPRIISNPWVPNLAEGLAP